MSHPTRLLLIRSISSFRATSEEEVLAALTPEELRLSRTILELDTQQHAESIASGFWGAVEAQVHDFAGRVHSDLLAKGPASIQFFGIEEVSTLVALGALLGDEHRIHCRDFDRDTQRFEWPEKRATLEWESVNQPNEVMTIAGDVVVRIMATGTIHDSHVDHAVPSDQRIAEITLRPLALTPEVGLIRSQEDVDSLRLAVRSLLADLERARPATQTIHLFVAGPVSVCLAVGQELRLRNGRRVQTYRYRTHDVPAQKLAILLTPETGSAVQMPLSEEDRAKAGLVREVWREALKQVADHAKECRKRGSWPTYLLPVLATAGQCLDRLAPTWELVSEADSIGDEDVSEFRFDRQKRLWSFSDRMLLAMGPSIGVDDERVRRLARAFFWHEYLHEYQVLTGSTAGGIGSFPNCLERVDYIADAYGTLHQVDFLLREMDVSEPTFATFREHLKNSVTEAIDAFWTFEPRPPSTTWQSRRLRRYLNWYWRREQIAFSNSAEEAVSLLCRPPIIEIAGPIVSTDSQRVIFNLQHVHADRLELSLIDEDNRLRRFPNQSNLSVAALLEAFQRHDRDAIDDYFSRLIDHSRPLAQSQGHDHDC